jgi:hypothetical protein
MDGHGVVERLTWSMAASCVASETTAAGKPRPPTPLDELWESQKRFSAGWLRDKFDFCLDGVPKGNNKQKKGSKHPSEEHAQQFLRDADSMAMCQRGTNSNPLSMEGTGFPLVFFFSQLFPQNTCPHFDVEVMPRPFQINWDHEANEKPHHG